MQKVRTPVRILIAEDDPDDRVLISEAFEETLGQNKLHFVGDGQELLEYLYNKGKYADPRLAPRPDLILLDLNMPRMDGREALERIKRDPLLRRIPVVVLTTSGSEDDIEWSYRLGVGGYVCKPLSLEELAQAMMVLSQYWFEIVELPTM
jgi:CheY-like chemotaxis protein